MFKNWQIYLHVEPLCKPLSDWTFLVLYTGFFLTLSPISTGGSRKDIIQRGQRIVKSPNIFRWLRVYLGNTEKPSREPSILSSSLRHNSRNTTHGVNKELTKTTIYGTKNFVNNCWGQRAIQCALSMFYWSYSQSYHILERLTITLPWWCSVLGDLDRRKNIDHGFGCIEAPIQQGGGAQTLLYWPKRP